MKRNIFVVHQHGQNLFVNPAGDRQPAVIVDMHAAVFHHPVVDYRIAGTADKSFHFPAGAEPNHLRSAADVNYRQRTPHFGRQRLVIHRGKRRPLSAGQNVRAAKTGRRFYAGQFRQPASVAYLVSVMFRRTVAYGMAGKAQNVRGNAFFTDKILHRGGGKFGKNRFRPADFRRMFGRIRAFSQNRTYLFKQFLFIRNDKRWPLPINVYAVGFHQSQSQPVERS